MKRARTESLDLVVAGGGVLGCMAAAAAAARGLSVTVVEKRAYLGREISALNHTFVRTDGTDDALRRCPEAFRELFRLHGAGEILAPEGLTRRILGRMMDERRIPVLYEAEPVALSRSDAGVTGLLLACPVGLAWLPARSVLDATESANVLRLVTGRACVDAGHVVLRAVFEMGLPAKFEDDVTEALRAAELELGLLPGSIRLHPTLSNTVTAIEYAFEAVSDGEPYVSRSRLESESRQRSGALASWLKERVPAFATGSLSHLAYECHVAPAGGVDASETGCANLVAVPPLPWGFSLQDVADSAERIEAMLSALEPRTVPEAIRTGELLGRGIRVAMAAVGFQPYEDDALAVPLFSASSCAAWVPETTLACDVCVAGVGAAGGMAMLAAAERGCRVTALEVNRDLGGTHTIGRVVGYYAGYRGGANAAVEEAGPMMPGAIVGHGPGGLRHAEYLRRKAEALGVRLLTGTRVCGVRTENRAVVQVLAANEDGLFAVAAGVTVDTTGDAEVAALAGAGYRIGDDDDGMVQTYSMWGAEVYPSSSFLAQRYLTDPGLFHPDVYSERIRAVTVAHRDNSYSHVSPMLTPREGRRIEGDDALTLDDILRQRLFDNVIAVACTQADSHAYTSSDLARLGTIGAGRHLRVRIPYGCFVPKGIDRLLVAAKAISGERDATSFCRMNADVKNAGYAVGAAAAACVKAGCGVRGVDLAALQAELRTVGVLPDWAFAVDGEEAFAQPADALRDGNPATLLRVLSCPAADLPARLEARYSTLAGADEGSPPSFFSERTMVCMALAWLGSAVGNEDLAVLLARCVAEGRHLTLPHLNVFRMSVVGNSTGGDDYSVVNRLLAVAGRSGGTAVLAPLAKIVADTPGLGDALPHVMPYDRNRGDIVAEPFYVRLRQIAFAVTRKADAALAPAMDALLRREGVTGHSVSMHANGSPRYMLTHLEISLARAAACCGSRVGAAILIRYLTDTHVFFRRHARQVLSRIAGADMGDAEAWQNWLDRTPAWAAVPRHASRRT